jgi:hypothetical protein
MKGGKRPGAGRPKGARDKISKELEKAVAEMPSTLGDGLLPLDYMLAVMRDQKADDSMRLEAAKSAAPYVHKKQPADVNLTGVEVPATVQIIVPAFGVKQ